MTRVFRVLVRVLVMGLALALLILALHALRASRAPRLLEPLAGNDVSPAGPASGLEAGAARESAGRQRPEGVAAEVEGDGPAADTGFVQARFVDELGSPIAGVELTLRAGQGSSRSAANGVARLELGTEVLAPGRRLGFEARHPAFARDAREASGSAGGRLLLGDWRLVAGASVEGRVVDEHGLGVADARVACLRAELLEADWARDSRLGLEACARPGARATSAADGSFRLEEIPAGRIRLVAEAGDRPLARSAPVDVLPGGLASGVRIELVPADGGTRITGIVLDPERRAVPLAHLVVRTAKSELRDRAGPDGRFDFVCDDFTPRDLIALDPEQRRREAVRLGVRPGTGGVELQLTPAPEVEVRVRTQDGQPVEHFALAVLAEERNLPLAFFPDAERPGGLARFGAPAQDFRVEVRADGYRPTPSGALAAATPPARIELCLARAGCLRGRVTAAGGALAGARVTLHRAEERRATHSGFPLRLQPEPVADEESGADGAFVLSVPETGSYHLLVEKAGFARAERGPFVLTTEAEREELVELDAGGQLALRVRAADPAAVAGVLVAFSRGDGLAFTERTDEQGCIALELLTPGPWQVERSEQELDPRYGSTRHSQRAAEPMPSNCRVRAGETTHVELWLDGESEHACRLSGSLRLDGAPATGFVAALERDGDLVLEQPFCEPGLFRLGLDEPGAYRLRLTADAAEPGAMLVLLEPLELLEGERHWSLELTTGALEGTFASGAEPALVFHRWRRGALECLAPLVPDEDGRFHAPRVPSGAGEVVRFDPARALAEQTPEILRTLTIEPGGTTDVEL